MKYAPSIWDFQTGFFMIERAREPYFLVSSAGEVLRSNKVGERLLTRLMRTKPQALEKLICGLHDLVAKPTQKAVTIMLDRNRKRVLRAIPVEAGKGFLVEIDRV